MNGTKAFVCWVRVNLTHVVNKHIISRHLVGVYKRLNVYKRYKRLNGVCPDYMLELLKRNIDIRSTERQTRYGSLNLICPKYKRESEGARTFQVSATRFWNSLPNEIKCSSSFEILKKSLFKYFLESYKDVYHFTIA